MGSIGEFIFEVGFNRKCRLLFVDTGPVGELEEGPGSLYVCKGVYESS